MASRSVASIPKIAFLIDAVAITVCLVTAVVARNELKIFELPNADRTLTLLAPVIGVAWIVLLWGMDCYQDETFEAGTSEIRPVLNASLTCAGLVCATSYLAHHQLSRGFFLLTFVLGIPLLLVGRISLRTFLHWARTHNHLREPVLLVGAAANVDEVAAVFARERWLGYTVVGALTPEGRSETPAGIPVIGSTDDLYVNVLSSGAATVLFAGGTSLSATELRSLIWDLEAHKVRLVVAPTMTDISADRVKIRPVGGLPLVHMDPPRWSHATRNAKRMFDIVGSLVLLVLTSPLLLFAAVSVKSADGGPVFYKQRRIGRDGMPFDCLKFRTMIVNADAALAALQAARGQSAMLFKMKDDPRITRPGTWLRKYSVDELPQLFNVLRGDMSLVGPRPQVETEVEMYDVGMERRLRVRPGMTGLWQVSGRSDLSYEDARRLDIYYVDNWSMTQDLSILWRTFGAVLAGRGAY